MQQGPIQEKYRTRSAFSPEEIQFLNVISEKIPIYKYIQLAVASRTSFLEEILEVVGLYVLLGNVEALSGDVLKWVEALESVQVSDLDIKKFKEGVVKLKSDIVMRLVSLDQKLWVYQKKAKAIEASLVSKEYLS